MPFRIFKIAFLSVVLLLFSCSEDEPALPTMLVNPSALESVVEPGQVVTFSVEIEAEAGIDRLEILENINQGGASVIYDTLLTGKNNANVVYNYRMPDTKDSTDIIVVFKVYDQVGEIATNTRKLSIDADYTKLEEIKNIQLFSGFSDSLNGYIVALDSLFNSDSTLAGDLDFLSNDTSETLLRQWESPKNHSFVKFNSFNYDSASYATVSNAYDLGVESSKLGSISVNDIVLVKMNASPFYDFVVLKFVKVSDQPGSKNDYYVFHLKK